MNGTSSFFTKTIYIVSSQKSRADILHSFGHAIIQYEILWVFHMLWKTLCISGQIIMNDSGVCLFLVYHRSRTICVHEYTSTFTTLLFGVISLALHFLFLFPFIFCLAHILWIWRVSEEQNLCIYCSNLARCTNLHTQRNGRM